MRRNRHLDRRALRSCCRFGSELARLCVLDQQVEGIQRGNDISVGEELFEVLLYQLRHVSLRVERCVRCLRQRFARCHHC